MPGSTYKKKKSSPLILHVQPLDNYWLRLEMGSGSVLELNLENRLHTIQFCPLKDREVFRSVTTDGEALFFGDALEIGAEEIMNLALTTPPARKEDK